MAEGAAHETPDRLGLPGRRQRGKALATPRSPRTPLLQAGAATSPAAVAPVERDHELWAAVAQLPERMRAVVVLRYVTDLTEPKIAETLGIRRGTVATMLRRAHERLAADLGPTYRPTTLATAGAV